MKFISTIIILILLLILANSAIEAGIWPVIVLCIILISSLNNKKKKKKRKKKIKDKNSKKIDYNKSFTLADYELNANNYKTSQYASEPINQTEKFISDKNKLARLRQMKTLKATNSNQLFALQASFMDDFEDDYNIDIPCKIYTPDYNQLNIYQLRSFFSWRTLVKKGIYKKTATSYIYLYIYELLNKIGVKNTIDGLNRLIELWHNCREYDNSLDHYLPIWIKDYYIINQINIDYKLIEHEFPITTSNKNHIISEIIIGNYNDKLKFYDEISSYHILKSKIMDNKYSFIIEMVVPKIFENLDKYFNENNYSFNKILFGEIKKDYWVPFINAIYYDNNLTSDFNVCINNYEKYYRINKIYYKETFEFSNYSKYLMGYILKNIDIVLRECLKMPKTLKINNSMLEIIQQNQKLYDFLTNGKIVDIINITIKKYLIENSNSIKNIITNKNKQEIIIDSKQFETIRQSANRVQEKLIVEEEPIITTIGEQIKEQPIEPVITSDNNFINLIKNLNDSEIVFLTKIVKGVSKDNLIDYCKEKNILYEIMVENINSKALEIIGDNLLEDYGEEIIIYAEYLDSIKDNIGGNENE